MELNSVTEKLPKYLHKFIVKQPYEEYTAQNQAVWRYVMRLNINSLKNIAHDCYIDGLKKTGIDSDQIPEMEGMNRILKEIGWAAVAVDGFIPPNAFMEFQSYNVLVISSEIRTIDHIKYTPAPDIIHEAAGHAPIIANQEYSEYLRRLGEIGSKAISSPKDEEMYEAVRLLSILKENPNSSKEDIDSANNNVNRLQNEMSELSEMAKIRNLHWWTVEYGLIGDINNPKIYGAGLLSSIEESQACLEKGVKKIPYSIDAANINFDITKAQPQLFVIPVMYVSLQISAILSVISEPFLPNTSKKLQNILNSRDHLTEWTWDNLNKNMTLIKTGVNINNAELLFTKIEDKEIDFQISKLNSSKKSKSIVSKKQEVNINDFSKLNLKIGTILEAKKIKKSKKLLLLKVDIKDEVRTIVSGIAKSYNPHDIVGTKVVVLTNLETKVIAGVQSQGMVLLTKDENDIDVFISPDNISTNDGLDIS